MNTLKRVLAAVDFSPSSADALRQAERIASWNLAALTVVHAVDPMFLAWSPPDVFQAQIPTPADMIDEARRAWLRFAPDAAVQPETPLAVVVGSPRQVILDAVRDGADLLVLGTHSIADAGRGVGTVAAGCMRASPVPVLAVRRGHTARFRSILVGVDFAPASLQALDAAVRIATQDAAAVHVLHVYQDPWIVPPPGIEKNMPDFAAQYQRAIDARLREFCAPLKHELNALKVEYRSERAGYRSGLIPFADRHGCDLLVLGTRGRWSVRDFLMGSTAERVAREAACSVLTIPPKKDS